MNTQYFNIQFKQPVIVSQQAATAGQHQSLDYIPGSAILGLVASQLYAQLTPEEALQVFHSGAVRFSDALPVCQGQTAFPVPLCWHHSKGSHYHRHGRLDPNEIYDVSRKDRDLLQSQQPVQLRNFYVTEQGMRWIPNKVQTLKTAIDSNKNSAAEGQLFGYDALAAGQEYTFSVQTQAEVPASIVSKIQQVLEGAAWLGRSRSAQFGQVAISAQSAATVLAQAPHSDNTLTLWLLSDMHLLKNGQPTLVPDAELLGLPAGSRWLPEQSFIRSRRYSLYNSFRRHYDREKQVLSRGSVLRFALPAGTSLSADLVDRLQQGVGLGREVGLGSVWVNPPLLQNVGTPEAWSAEMAVAVPAATPVAEPKSTLIRALKYKAKDQTIHLQPIALAKSIFDALCEKVGIARDYHAMANGVPFDAGKIPNRTQFGRFKELANLNRNDPSKLWEELCNERNGVLHVGAETEQTNRQSGASYERAGWQQSFGFGSADNLGTWLKTTLEAHRHEIWFPELIGVLSTHGLSEKWEQCCLGKDK